jgi:hypothetical protein
MLAAGHAASFDLFNLCVWVKNNGGMGSLYRSRHELVFVFRNDIVVCAENLIRVGGVRESAILAA